MRRGRRRTRSRRRRAGWALQVAHVELAGHRGLCGLGEPYREDMSVLAGLRRDPAGGRTRRYHEVLQRRRRRRGNRKAHRVASLCVPVDQKMLVPAATAFIAPIPREEHPVLPRLIVFGRAREEREERMQLRMRTVLRVDSEQPDRRYRCAVELRARAIERPARLEEIPEVRPPRSVEVAELESVRFEDDAWW